MQFLCKLIFVPMHINLNFITKILHQSSLCKKGNMPSEKYPISANFVHSGGIISAQKYTFIHRNPNVVK